MALRDVLSMDDIPRAAVECPEWGQTVNVRALGLFERTKLVALANADYADGDAGRNAELSVWLVIYGVVEPDGTNAFTANDLDALRKKNPTVIERLASKIGELSKIGEAADGLEKNSETTPSDGSSSA